MCLARASSPALATLDGAEDIQVPAGHKVVFAAYAEGFEDLSMERHELEVS